jgi:hypothetical protein
MKYILSIAALLLSLSIADAELMIVKLKIIEKTYRWSYLADEQPLESDAELGEFLTRLSNPRSEIWLDMESEGDVPIDQLSTIWGLTRFNPQGIKIRKIVLANAVLSRQQMDAIWLNHLRSQVCWAILVLSGFLMMGLLLLAKMRQKMWKHSCAAFHWL